MKYEEAAVEIEKEIEHFHDTKTIYKFNLLYMYYHVNLFKKIKFWLL